MLRLQPRVLTTYGLARSFPASYCTKAPQNLSGDLLMFTIRFLRFLLASCSLPCALDSCTVQEISMVDGRRSTVRLGSCTVHGASPG
jgi:hypothetical protein